MVHLILEQFLSSDFLNYKIIKSQTQMLGGGQAWPVRTRPNLKRPATLVVKKNQRKYFSLIWFDRKFRHPSLIWPANSAVQIFDRQKAALKTLKKKLCLKMIFRHLEVDNQFKISFQFEDALHVIVYFEIFNYKIFKQNNIKFQINADFSEILLENTSKTILLLDFDLGFTLRVVNTSFTKIFELELSLSIISLILDILFSNGFSCSSLDSMSESCFTLTRLSLTCGVDLVALDEPESIIFDTSNSAISFSLSLLALNRLRLAIDSD
ncbi:hypothetical protein BpHYR1_006113 [Brachionus plicatilis]|uniref:Uncharacterized protein n=1 Tax=Brachionus plicatilis TaxID=10195 RepID=A0A3M7Q0H3_BRAPC|nr:hypothetical protein BpHYR1_006113 [Brachionus plicatilis]